MTVSNAERLSCYEVVCKTIRREVLNLIYDTKSPHIGSCFSIVEILVALYYKVLSVSPDRPDAENRDRFILSKGHACPALYAVLFHRGFLTREVLDGYAVDGGTLEQHPTRDIMRGIEVSTGSLGHGLSIGAGMAVAARHNGDSHRVFVLSGDGEMDEGDVWEAALFASHHQLDNLVSIIDYNQIQALGSTNEVLNLEPLGPKWAAFGWDVREVDGHDVDEIVSALGKRPAGNGKPVAIIAHTTKGKGVSFMEDKLLWHYRCPDAHEYSKALQELS